MLRTQFVLAVFLAAALASAQTPGIDPVLLAKANAGDASAQAQVADDYAAGAGVPRDLKQAAEWYRKAAEQGLAEAQVHLADLYRDGRGVPRDMAQAAALYRKAAEQGNTAAQGTLGVLYSLGQGVPRDDVEAYCWFKLAAAVKGPNQDRYEANRQAVAAKITADEQAQAEERVAKWQSEHSQRK
jgi:TPR repeat protein